MARARSLLALLLIASSAACRCPAAGLPDALLNRGLEPYCRPGPVRGGCTAWFRSYPCPDATLTRVDYQAENDPRGQVRRYAGRSIEWHAEADTTAVRPLDLAAAVCLAHPARTETEGHAAAARHPGRIREEAVVTADDGRFAYLYWPESRQYQRGPHPRYRLADTLRGYLDRAFGRAPRGARSTVRQQMQGARPARVVEVTWQGRTRGAGTCSARAVIDDATGRLARVEMHSEDDEFTVVIDAPVYGPPSSVPPYRWRPPRGYTVRPAGQGMARP